MDPGVMKRAWVVFLTAFFLLVFTLPSKAGEVREFVGQSCSETLAALSSAHPTESRVKQQDHSKKWVRWKGIFERKSETLWGYEVVAKCLSQKNPGQINISFDSKWKSSLDQLKQGQGFEYSAQISGFSNANDIELSDGEVTATNVSVTEEKPVSRQSSDSTAYPVRPSVENIPAPNRNNAEPRQEIHSAGIPAPPARNAVIPPLPGPDHPIRDSEVKSFVRNYLDLMERGADSALLAYYETQVEYYSAGMVTIDFIRKDKKNYLKKWKELKFIMLEPVDVVIDQNSRTASIRFVYEFSADSGKELSRGKAENFWKLKKTGGMFKIVSEKQKILSRKRF